MNDGRTMRSVGGLCLLAATGGCMLFGGPERLTVDGGLEAARDAVRAYKSAHGGVLPKGGLEVIVADGTYRRTDPVAFTTEDSGTKESPIVYRAKTRGGVTVSGSTRLDWRPLDAGKDAAVFDLIPEESRPHVKVATIPGQKPIPGFSSGGCIHGALTNLLEQPISLFQGGRRLICARWPDEGFAKVGDFQIKKKVTDNTFRKGGFRVRGANLESWAKEPELYMFGLWQFAYMDATAPVTNIDLKAGYVFLDMRLPGTIKRGRECYALNAFCELDVPGEWALDRRTRRIYAWPLDAAGTPEIAFNDRLLTARGLENVSFDGFVFECARQTALTFDGCSDVTIRASVVRHTSANGIDVCGGWRCKVVGCDLYDLGEGGVWMQGGDHDTLTPCEHTVDNCHIHHYGRVVYNYRPGVKLDGVGCRAVHNLMHHTPHQGVQFVGNDHYVGFNVMHDCCQWNDDAGVIYTYVPDDWSKRGTVVEYNCVHMTGKQPRTGATDAVYLDALTSGVTVRGNIINRATQGVFSSGGNDNVIEKNIVMNCGKPISRWNLGLMNGTKPFALAKKGMDSKLMHSLTDRLGLYQSDLWRRKYPNMLKPLEVAEAKGAVYAHNALFCRFTNNVIVTSGPIAITDREFTQDYTTVTNNLILDADPGFVDYFGMDWNLKPGSPAWGHLGGNSRFDEMGLYASSDRISPVMKFDPSVTPPRKFLAEYGEPIVRLDFEFRGENLPEACDAVADGLVNCRVAHWDAKRICASQGVADYHVWRDYYVSFVPKFDMDLVLMVMGQQGSKTYYDDFDVTGTELDNPSFEKKTGWRIPKMTELNALHADVTPPYGIVRAEHGVKPYAGKRMLSANHQIIVEQVLKVKKGVRVEIRFMARGTLD